MSKPAKTYEQQIDVLVERGLFVDDRAFAEHCFVHHNYYRLSPYRFPFTIEGNPDRFKPGARFEEIWQLYVFDRELRQLVLEATKRVEISVRSRLAYEMSHSVGPLSYCDAANFLASKIHANTMKRLEEEMSRSKEVFLKHHKIELHMDWPPIWVLVEVASFGSVSNLLKQIRQPSIRQAVANSYQMDEKTFCSLFHHLSVVRNTAAHHSRLWNRRFPVTFQLPKKKPDYLWENFSIEGIGVSKTERQIYNTLVLLVHLMQCIDPAGTWPDRLFRHICRLDDTLIGQMGFPIGWKKMPVWLSLAGQQ